MLGILCTARRVFEDNTRRDADGRTRHHQNRQPPAKKRHRTTLTPADPSAPLSPVSPPSPIINEEDKPISFVDMMFRGQLMTILVCQKCKHISQTYVERHQFKHQIGGLRASKPRHSSTRKPLSTVQCPPSVPPNFDFLRTEGGVQRSDAR